MSSLFLLGARGRGMGAIVGWFIRVVIYDICITGISDFFHIPRLMALFVFLAILGVIAFGGYIARQRFAPGVED